MAFTCISTYVRTLPEQRHSQGMSSKGGTTARYALETRTYWEHMRKSSAHSAVCPMQGPAEGERGDMLIYT